MMQFYGKRLALADFGYLPLYMLSNKIPEHCDAPSGLFDTSSSVFIACFNIPVQWRSVQHYRVFTHGSSYA